VNVNANAATGSSGRNPSSSNNIGGRRGRGGGSQFRHRSSARGGGGGGGGGGAGRGYTYARSESDPYPAVGPTMSGGNLGGSITGARFVSTYPYAEAKRATKNHKKTTPGGGAANSTNPTIDDANAVLSGHRGATVKHGFDNHFDYHFDYHFGKGRRVRVKNYVWKPTNWGNDVWNYRQAQVATVVYTTTDRVYYVTDNGIKTWRARHNLELIG
jgi:hypothetical protein